MVEIKHFNMNASDLMNITVRWLALISENKAIYSGRIGDVRRQDCLKRV
jgi:hypothetical protein